MTNSVESGMAPLNLNGLMSSEEHHKFMDWRIRRDVIAGSASPVLKWHLEGNAPGAGSAAHMTAVLGWRG